jgi:hypothetical protein
MRYMRMENARLTQAARLNDRIRATTRIRSTRNEKNRVVFEYDLLKVNPVKTGINNARIAP